ncbi:MAG: S41 family peptidase [Muribaculaceae bacterium]|nr:S41 family peptidase [Muribaculaceae bacterium]
MKHTLKLISIIALTLILSFSANAQKQNFELIKNNNIFNAILKELSLFYVDTIDAEKIITKGINSMLYSLDPYTTYIPKSEEHDLKFMTTGEYAGVGALISQRDSLIQITSIYEGNPAQKDGMKVGDRILEINGESMVGKTNDYVSEHLRGKANTLAVIKVERPSADSIITLNVTRKKIYIPAVSYYGVTRDDVGYIYISSFNTNTAAEVKEALLDLKKNYNIKSLIIDLRGNPGGLLNEAIGVINLFVQKGEKILETRGRLKELETIYKTSQKPIDTEIPLAVLIDDESASASEIVAGAFQDLDRAVIVGNRSFGKGLVQSTRPLPYEGTLKITTAKYYIPSGRLIQAIDYSHRDKDGKTTRIPDSLTTEFKTAAGRIVRDGGGITPDVEYKYPEQSNILYYLTIDYHIFDFATQYVATHPTIASANEFVLTDEEYNQFKEQLKTKNFTYDRESLKLLENLKEVAKFEGYIDVAGETIATLEKQLEHNLDKDLDKFKEDIKSRLEMDIVERYYYKKGVMSRGVEQDKCIEQAVDIVKDSIQYKQILSPKK